MLLYHGSNVAVEKPIIREKLRALDFGAGFYMTSSEAQAKKWAKSVTKRRRNGKPIVSVFQFEEADKENLKVLEFNDANSEWLEFVVANRLEKIVDSSYDLVIGPVANDSTLPVIDDYMDGKYTKEQAVERLLPQNLTDQYAFLSEKALRRLFFKESDIV